MKEALVEGAKKIGDKVVKETAKEVIKEGTKELAKEGVGVVVDGATAIEAPEINEEMLPDTESGERTDNKLWEAEGDKPKTPIQNKIDGLRREREVMEDLKIEHPESEGNEILQERELLDKDGNKALDPETGTGRRIDFIVNKDSKVIRSIEVTSETADKTEQMAKEQRIREAGGNYIKGNDGNLLEVPKDVKTEIIRRK